MAHMHYKGTGNMHSFRGLLVDGGQQRIRIQGATGDIAWRITKFEGFPNLPGTTDWESTLQVFREEQTSVSTDTATVNFDDNELLAAIYYPDSAYIHYKAGGITVVFDNILFSRNIYVTHTNTGGSDSMNYYLELEKVKVSATGMAQLAVAAARRIYVPGT